MSKRCCAKNCFNSVLYNNNIAYFSFPKKKEFAQQWAELSGRRDLMEKPLSRLVKYYLCSEHFTSNCFVDKESRQTLKRNLPHFIALPTIFKNNLQETMQHINPRNSIEVHNIVLLDVDERVREQSFQKSGDECSSVKKYLPPSKSDFDEYEKSMHEYMDTYSEVSNNDKCQENICSSLALDEPPKRCRLCFSELNAEDFGINFKDSMDLKEFITRIMQDRISIDDGMSQIVCKNCEKNALLCLIIVQQMDNAQGKTLPR